MHAFSTPHGKICHPSMYSNMITNYHTDHFVHSFKAWNRKKCQPITNHYISNTMTECSMEKRSSYNNDTTSLFSFNPSALNALQLIKQLVSLLFLFNPFAPTHKMQANVSVLILYLTLMFNQSWVSLSSYSWIAMFPKTFKK